MLGLMDNNKMEILNKQKWIFFLAIIGVYRLFLDSFEGLLTFYIIFWVTAMGGIYVYFKIYAKHSGNIKFITTYSNTLKWQLTTVGLFKLIPFLVAGYFVGLFDMSAKYITCLPNLAVELALILSAIYIIMMRLKLK